MMNPAGPDEKRVEFVPMLLEKAKLGTDHVNFRKGQKRVQAGTGENKSEYRDSNAQNPPPEGEMGLWRIG